MEPIRVFTIYSPEDEKHCKTLDMHLYGARKLGLVTRVYDPVERGDALAEVLEQRFEAAQILLVLVTARLFADEDAESRVERALARPIADPTLRLALERLVSLAHVRLAVVLLDRNRPDEVARALHLGLASDRAPEIIADVALARGTFAPLREQPIWAELLAAQRGHRPPPDPAHAHRHPR